MRKEENKFLGFISELLALFSKYDKKELSNFRNILEEIMGGRDVKVKQRRGYVKKQGEKAKNEIIGGLPSVSTS